MKCSLCGRNFRGDKILEKWKESLRKALTPYFIQWNKERYNVYSWKDFKVCENCLFKIDHRMM